MPIRNTMLLVSLIMGGGIIPVAIPDISHADADIIVTTAPPAPREEVIPSPRKGYTWAAGYWKWENNEHVWVEGHWIEERPNEHWVPDRWTQDANDPNHWHFRAGHWEEG